MTTLSFIITCLNMLQQLILLHNDTALHYNAVTSLHLIYISLNGSLAYVTAPIVIMFQMIFLWWKEADKVSKPCMKPQNELFYELSFFNRIMLCIYLLDVIIDFLNTIQTGIIRNFVGRSCLTNI